MLKNISCNLCVEIKSLQAEKYTDKILLNFGNHFQYVHYDYKLMKKYYLMAIDKGNLEAMNNLGIYYATIEKNYDLMKKYYLMAIEKGNL